MKNELLGKDIILPSGEIGKGKINLAAGAITQPFAEMRWVTTGGDMKTINRLTDILVTMNTPADRGKMFKIIKMLYGPMRLPFSGKPGLRAYLVEELEAPELSDEVKRYFMYEEYVRDASINDDGMFTEKGYIYNNRCQLSIPGFELLMGKRCGSLR